MDILNWPMADCRSNEESSVLSMGQVLPSPDGHSQRSIKHL